VESSCKLGNEPSGSIKCWELPNDCTTGGLSSGTQLHIVSLIVSCNIDIIQRYHNKVLRCLVNALWHARNSDIHRDPGVETVASIIARHTISHENRLQHDVNEEASKLLNVQHLIGRLKRTKPFELVKQFDN
jgi:hypothetical protein